MKTMYAQTSHFIRHTGNIVNLDEYRRRPELAWETSLVQQAGLSRETEEGSRIPEDAPGFCPMVLTMSRAERQSARRERRAWCLDVCASLAVVFMTLAFALRVLL